MTILRDEPVLNADNYRPPELSEDALAMGFAERHANDLRYVATLKRWFRWDGARWADDETNNIPYLARMVCREAAVEHEKSGIASARTFAAVERIAQSDPQLAAKLDQFDANPWLEYAWRRCRSENRRATSGSA